MQLALLIGVSVQARACEACHLRMRSQKRAPRFYTWAQGQPVLVIFLETSCIPL